MKKNSKNDGYIYHALNYYQIEEDTDIDNVDKIDEITSKRIKKLLDNKIKRNKPKYRGFKAIGLGLFIAINVILLSSGGVKVYANIGKSIVASFAKLIGDVGEYDKYTSMVNASVTDKGIKFVINEVISDGNHLVVSYSIISDASLKDKLKDISEIGSWPSINGKQFSGLTREGKMISENRYDGCDWVKDSEGIIPKGDFYLDIQMKDIGKLKGNWDISVKVNSDKIKEKVKEYKVNKNIKTVKNQNITIKKIITSPLSVGVKCTSSYGRDSYTLFDDKGNQLDFKGVHTSDGNITMDYSGLLSEDTKSLTFVPFKIKEDYEPRFEIYSLDKLPIKIDQGKYGSFTVKKAEWIEKDKLKISYEVDSKYPLTVSAAPILLDPNNKEMDSDKLTNYQVSRGDLKNFEKVFSGLDRSKIYKLGAHKMYEWHIMYEDKAFTINLKK
ncbi:DUF4179 domain-containing protein [Clostridium cylindrosporum]|uniref:DUF4179 domain-containing protein n=1 Tax=Clostridium cylindrosporum DSM 605 TaxID=1121307 RepID=A0A0J8D3Q4_CLOCY|nr:DUF4179 domain-containing protein [Clostridium cylindrosporum]KMT20805.1 hypothetical protein CLCY_1c00370 [Clostridium cylindrosporum DSM 605]